MKLNTFFMRVIPVYYKSYSTFKTDCRICSHYKTDKEGFKTFGCYRLGSDFEHQVNLFERACGDFKLNNNKRLKLI